MTRISDMTPVQVTSPTGMYAPVEKTGSTTNYRVDLAAMSSVTPQMFGAVADGVTDDSAAFVAAIAYLKSIAVNNDGGLYKGSAQLFVPCGLYNMGTTTLDISHTIIIEGESTILGKSSKLKWSGDCDGIRVQGYNTSGAATVDGPHFSGSYTMIKGLALAGPYENSADFTGHTESESHGINARTNVVIEDVLIDGFAGDGIRAFTSVGGGTSEEGNSNCSFIHRVRITNCRDHIHIDGSDANAWDINGVVGTYARRWTIFDGSFLGNSYRRVHSAGAGLIPGVAATVVSYSGNRYAVRVGQSVGASTNAPSGTTADNTWWLYLAAGGVNAGSNIIAWISGVSVREGGTAWFDNNTAENEVDAWYQEGSEGPVQFQKPTLILGGIWGSRNPVTVTSNPGNRLGGETYELLTGGLLGQTRVAFDGGTSGNILNVHNSGALAAGPKAEMRLSQGFEADGITPASLAGFYGYFNTNSPATAEATVVLRTRTLAGAGAMTDRVMWDSINAQYRPTTTATWDLGGTTDWRNLTLSGVVKIGGVQVLGARQTGWTAATGTPSRGAFAAAAAGTASVGYVQAELQAALTRIAALEARLVGYDADLRTTGIIGT